MKRFCFFLLVLCMLLTIGACSSQPPATSHGGPVQDYMSLIDQLRAHHAIVTPTGEVTQPFFSVQGKTITVNAEPVQVYEYPNAAAAFAAAASISPDGGTIGNSVIDWVAPPHFYQAGKVVVLYVGSSDAALKPLTTVLGPQFAGR